MTPSDRSARTAPAVARNREPILQVLKGLLPPQGRVLEIASGTGEHAVFFAAALPDISWRPSDRDAASLASIAAWREAASLSNLMAPLRVDASVPASWPTDPVDAVVCINMLHISPWAAAEGLFAGAAKVLAAKGLLFLYGPFIEPDRATASSNLAFDQDLRSRDPAWGVRGLDAVTALARRNGFGLAARVEMPANNLSVAFRRG